MKAKDFFLFALAFILTSFFTFIFQWTYIRGRGADVYHIFSVVWLVFIFLAISFSISGIIKYVTEKKAYQKKGNGFLSAHYINSGILVSVRFISKRMLSFSTSISNETFNGNDISGST